jgi:hypothetical protein
MKLKKITQKQINNIKLRFWIYKGFLSDWDYESPFFKPRNTEYLKTMPSQFVMTPYKFPLKNTYFAHYSDPSDDTVIKGFHVFPNIQWLLSNEYDKDVEQIFLIPEIEEIFDYARRLWNKECLNK